MKKRVRLQTAPQTNTATNLWLQHLISRMVVEQLQLPPRLKAKLLYETLSKQEWGE
ncbi:hypothetical protein [Neobacillus mesonae]|uniref:hypothetical protein n=1 Tax=Neobacillus mesonae TaxID=1193713 RepID=UPI00203BB4E9|nr:hypothetical protein [Neobacillus mesonae]MCM3569221.1 hypothetical protein [Neobacillus mesonae]